MNIVLATSLDFNTVFPNFQSSVHQLSSALVPVAAVLCFAGLITAAIKAMHGNYMALFGKLITVAVIAAALGSVGTWTQQIVSGVDDLTTNQLGANPANVSQQFQALLASPTGQNTQGFWDKVMNPQATVAQAIAAVIIWITGKIAWLLRWWMTFAQAALLYFALALAPIFLGMFALDSMKQVGFRWTLGVVSIAIWPLGWAVADLMTQALLQRAADQSFVNAVGGNAGSTVTAFQTYVFILAVSIWVIITTIAAPVIISSAIMNGGAMIGQQLFGATVSGAASGVSMAGSMGSTAAMAAGGSAAMAAAGGGADGAGAGSGGGGGGGGAGGGGISSSASAGSAGIDASAPSTPRDVVGKAKALAAAMN